MNFDWLITFQSVTYAQRGERLLQQKGINCALRRTPRELSQKGCGYCLAIRGRDAIGAVELLRENEVPFGKLYGQTVGGGMEERVL